MSVPVWQLPDSHDCTKCSGLGIYYDPEVAVGRYGELKICECVEKKCVCRGEPPYQFWDEETRHKWCECRSFRRRLIETNRLFKASEIPERYKWKFLNSFQKTTPDGASVPFAEEVCSRVFTLTDNEVSSQPTKGFLLHGNPGTGKTLLGSIMLNELILRWGRPGRFLNLSRKYFQKLRDTYSQESANYGRSWDIVDELCNVPFLLLDDFGIQRGTDWEMEMLYELVDARYSDNRFTIVTTNQDLDEIQSLSGGRIYSRLSEMCHLVPMNGVDFRKYG